MKIDTEWFTQKIKESRFGSLRQLAAAMRGRTGKVLDPAAVSLMLRGEREIFLIEAEQLSELLEVPILEVLARAGGKVPSQSKLTKALEFYASGGEDGGKRAKSALPELGTCALLPHLRP